MKTRRQHLRPAWRAIPRIASAPSYSRSGCLKSLGRENHPHPLNPPPFHRAERKTKRMRMRMRMRKIPPEIGVVRQPLSHSAMLRPARGGVGRLCQTPREREALRAAGVCHTRTPLPESAAACRPPDPSLLRPAAPCRPVGTPPPGPATSCRPCQTPPAPADTPLQTCNRPPAPAGSHLQTCKPLPAGRFLDLCTE
jgi:hypothetical protein